MNVQSLNYLIYSQYCLYPFVRCIDHFPWYQKDILFIYIGNQQIYEHEYKQQNLFYRCEISDHNYFQTIIILKDIFISQKQSINEMCAASVIQL